MNKEAELWIIKKTDFFPGEEFHENLYIGFKEDTLITYQKIIQTLKEENYEIEEVDFLERVGFKLETSFISMEPVKNKKNQEILKEITGKV
ncbi:MAG: hypothetical protein ACRC41_16590 [Sarcina sp.]